MQMAPSPLPEKTLPALDQVFRSRWQALLSVDDMVADIVGALENNHLLDNTYLVFTSDNGYHIGKIITFRSYLTSIFNSRTNFSEILYKLYFFVTNLPIPNR